MRPTTMAIAGAGVKTTDFPRRPARRESTRREPISNIGGRMPFRLLTAPVVAVCLVVLAACGPRADNHAAVSTDSSAKAPASSSSAAAANVVTITAKDFSFDAPARLPAGITVVRIVNQGREMHQVAFVRLTGGKTAADLAASMKQPGPPPAWAISAGGPNAAVPGASAEATVTLEPGNYVLLCEIPSSDQVPHMMKGMVSPLLVTAESNGVSSEPQSDITLSLSDYTFSLSSPIASGAHTIRVENHGLQDHETVLIRLAPGKTAKDMLAWVDKQVGPPPGVPLGGNTGIATGAHTFFTSDFTPGRYALMCFLPDMRDGKPHVVHGMVKEFTVS